MLDSKTLDDIFGRLHLRYGVKLTAAYQGLDMAYVKGDWAEVLDGSSPRAVTHALANLPLEWPPTAGQFLALCHQVPEAPRPIALPEPKPTEADKERVRKMISGLRRKLVASV